PQQDFSDRFGMRTVAAAITIILAMALGSPCLAAWTHGQFQSAGKPVEENHCVPSGAGPFPAVIMLHGAGPRNMATDDFEGFCSKLADYGYYTEFIEYYSQTDAASPGDIDGMVHNFPIWLNEVHSGIAALKKNPSVNANKVGLMGFSLGAFMSLTYGATYPSDVAAIFLYFGGWSP